MRVSVPGLRKYVDFYEGKDNNGFFDKFPQKALALSFMTQMHYHRSTWDGELMTALLEDIGFVNVREVTHGVGTDARLIKDQDDKAGESLYVEAKKP